MNNRQFDAKCASHFDKMLNDYLDDDEEIEQYIDEPKKIKLKIENYEKDKN